MGYARWDAADWSRYEAGLRGRRANEIFRSRGIATELDPKRIEMRESRDSDLNPASTPVIVGVDVTGSMGHLAELLVRRGVAELMEKMLAGDTITDPHLMCMGVGDAWCDRAPLQATQFEADLRVVEQLSRVWIEGGGGGNGHESYVLPWAFAAAKTSCDAIEKRGRKGYLFTVGDDAPPPGLLRSHAELFLGIRLDRDMGARDLLEIVSRDWEVFHIMIEEGSNMRYGAERVRAAWRDLLGERAISLTDHTRMAEAIIATIEMCEGTGGGFASNRSSPFGTAAKAWGAATRALSTLR